VVAIWREYLYVRRLGRILVVVISRGKKAGRIIGHKLRVVLNVGMDLIRWVVPTPGRSCSTSYRCSVCLSRHYLLVNHVILSSRAHATERFHVFVSLLGARG
jgi:hypothetical protein